MATWLGLTVARVRSRTPVDPIVRRRSLPIGRCVRSAYRACNGRRRAFEPSVAGAESLYHQLGIILMTMLDRMRRHKGWLKWSLGARGADIRVFYIPTSCSRRPRPPGRLAAK